MENPDTGASGGPRSGLLLAAGHSRRMGTDKALLQVGGQPLWRRQRDVLLESGAAEVLLSARDEQTWAIGADGFTAVVRDSVPDFGPLAGLVTGLECAHGRPLLVLAIDLPRMEPAWFARLARQCSRGVGAVGRREACYEPLAAIYPAEILPLAREALRRGRRSLQQLLATAIERGLMRVHEITPAELPWLENWNEPAPRQA